MDIDAAAEAIWAAAQEGRYYPQEWKGRFDLEDAYRIQLAIMERRLAAGERQAGWKVGLTAKAIQEQEGFHEPIFGCLFEGGRIPSGTTLDTATLIRPGFENELCLTVGEPLQGPGVTRAQARAAICAVAPALELVEQRGPFSEAPPLAIADNVGQKGFVVADAVQTLPAEFALATVHASVRINDELVDEADGEAVLGDPAEALAWLANKLAEHGRRIEAGMQVMSGSFTRYYPLSPGDRIETHFEPVGTVRLVMR